MTFEFFDSGSGIEELGLSFLESEVRFEFGTFGGVFEFFDFSEGSS
jgi:hypothetical protein